MHNWGEKKVIYQERPTEGNRLDGTGVYEGGRKKKKDLVTGRGRHQIEGKEKMFRTGLTRGGLKKRKG